MTLSEIRESGLLELYAIGDIDPSDKKIVEGAFLKYPELKDELKEIGDALRNYAAIHQMTPSSDLKEKLMSQAKEQGLFDQSSTQLPPPKRSGGLPGWVTAFTALAAALFGYLYFTTHNRVTDLQDQQARDRIVCDSINEESQIQFALIEQLQDPSNQIIPIQPTDKFSETEIYLIYNAERQQNFVQVQNLPRITDQQSYQLWSLKPDQAPIPMNVFQGTEGVFIPVDYEDGTATYAITIEPYGGLQSPTLDNLIGTVNVTG